MAEDFTAEDLPEWTGSLLSYGAFLVYAQRTVKSFRKIASQRRRKYAKRRAEAAAGGEPQGQEGRDGASAGV